MQFAFSIFFASPIFLSIISVLFSLVHERIIDCRISSYFKPQMIFSYDKKCVSVNTCTSIFTWSISVFKRIIIRLHNDMPTISKAAWYRCSIICWNYGTMRCIFTSNLYRKTKWRPNKRRMTPKVIYPTIVAAILERWNCHKSSYVKVRRCTFWWITMFITEKPCVKLFEVQAEVLGWQKFCQGPIKSYNKHDLS